MFRALFEAHGIPCRLDRDWIVPDSARFVARAIVEERAMRPGQHTARLDLEVGLATGQVLREACAGVGATAADAVADAIRNCVEGTFHVLCGAIEGVESSHCTVEEWTIGGRQRRVFLGPLVCRGGDDFLKGFDPLGPMIRGVEALELDAGPHWLRLYHAEVAGRPPTDEALLDNEDCPGLRVALAGLAWPPSTGFTSARWFLMIGVDPLQTAPPTA